MHKNFLVYFIKENNLNSKKMEIIDFYLIGLYVMSPAAQMRPLEKVLKNCQAGLLEKVKLYIHFK
jgi:hypothetical protein